jgi:hypothetical protein
MFGSVDEAQVEGWTPSRNGKASSSIDIDTVEDEGGVRMEEKWEEVVKLNPFLYLSLDIPPVPLFKVSVLMNFFSIRVFSDQPVCYNLL